MSILHRSGLSETELRRPPASESAQDAQAGRQAGSSEPKPDTVRVNSVDDATMVCIPAGPFPMGDDDRSDNPRHTVTLSEYWIYKTPVTVKQYKQFCRATGKQMPAEPGGHRVVAVDVPKFNPNWSKEDHPIVNVSWEDATAYCKWLSAESGASYSLPTETQWEKAARGTDGRAYPWRSAWDSSQCSCSLKAYGYSKSTCPVGSYAGGASPYGVLDMSGNVWEWCSDWYDPNYWQGDHGADPLGPVCGDVRVVRGGSWLNVAADYFLCAYRSGTIPTDIGIGIGFRCVRRLNSL